MASSPQVARVLPPDPDPGRTPRVRQIGGICLDGLPFIGAFFLIALGAFFLSGWGWALLPAGFGVFSLWFFRDPVRTPPADAAAIVSPADGRVVGVQRVPYPRLLQGEATRVSIFLSVFNVHVNRIPTSGKVRETKYHPGKFMAAFAEKASLDNEQMAVVVDTDCGIPVMFVQIAGLIARRIICRLKPEESVVRGERYGLIRFGSRADVYFTDEVEVKVKVGDRVRGGETVLGVFQ